MSRSTASTSRRAPAAGIAAPADRRFRRSDVRPHRRRIGQKLLQIAKWTAPLIAVAAAAVWTAQLAMTSHLLVVKHLAVRGNVRLSAGEIETLVDGLRGENIFQVDFDAYRRRVMDSPWVATVTLARVLPSTIAITVTERTPMAIARLGQQLYLVDDTGMIIDDYGPAYHDLDLPIVDGLLSTAAQSGPSPDEGRVRLTDLFLPTIGTRADLRRRLSQVDVSNAHDAVVMFEGDPAWLHLGEDAFTERLNTYLELVPTLRERFREIEYVDLRFDERVFVHARGRTDSVGRVQ
jgi:cell division protein FtsQ